MSAREDLFATRPHPLYEGRDQDGVVFGPKIKSWGGWPIGVVPKLREWNKARGLRFVFTGRVFECRDCGDYIDSRGVAVCQIGRDFVCDDCVVALVKSGAADV